MKGHTLRLLLVLAALTTAVGIGAAQPEGPPKGHGKYLIVLWEPGTPIPGKKDERMKRVPEPDVAKLGGRLLAKQANRRVVFLPYGIAKQLRKHEAVSFVQRIWTGEPLSEWNESEMGGDTALRSPEVSADANPTFTWEKSYEYDADGNITEIGADQFEYDDLGRLTTAVVNGDAQAYFYDSFGNLTATSWPGGSVSVPTDPGTNRMTGQTYDAAGNVTSRKDRGTYEYDSLNMIVKYEALPQIGKRRILYDANDERIGTIIDSSLHRWTIRDFEGQILREFSGYDGGLNLVWSWEQDHIRGGGQLIAGETQQFGYMYEQSPQPAFLYGGKRHYHLDHLGSVRVVTNAAGRAISENDFFPFGREANKRYQEQLNQGQYHTDGMRFAGHWRDNMGHPEVEDDEYLDYMHARYYDPNLGRFLSVDPILGTPERPQSWNRYSYVENNPIGAIDPTGMKMECVTRDDGEECTVVPDDTSPPAPPLPDPPPSIIADLFPTADRWLTDNVMRPIDHGYARFQSLPTGVSAEECRAAGFCQTLTEAMDMMGPMVGGTGNLRSMLTRQVLANARRIATGTGIRDVERLVSTYGGRASGWVKKSTPPLRLGGRTVEIHWYEHAGLGKFELKLVYK